MIGQNQIQYNQATMVKAIESYLRDYVMKDPNFEVIEVKAEKDQFVITLKESEGRKPDHISQGSGV